MGSQKRPREKSLRAKKLPTDRLAEAQRHFAAEFFNETWRYLEKSGRTADEDMQMLSLAHASLVHWMARADCKPRNVAIGSWLLSRVYAVLRFPDLAERHARRSLQFAQNEGPLLLGFAHEALARAADLSEDRKAKNQSLAEAQKLASRVKPLSERKNLLTALKTLE
jgi:hypothetical protein